MPKSSLVANVATITVASSEQRWLADGSGNYFLWNHSTGLYQPVTLAAALDNGSVSLLALDPSGAAYVLGQVNGIWTISTWSPTNQSFSDPVPVATPRRGPITSFAVADGTFWFIQDDWIYSAPVGSSITLAPASLDAALPGCYPIQVTAAEQDGSTWILDQLNNLYIWDGSVFQLVSTSEPLPPSVQLVQVAIVNSNVLYALDQYGGVWQWSSVASKFINVSSNINNGNLEFRQIQSDETGLLYGIIATGTDLQYQVFDLGAFQDLADPNAVINSTATYTDPSGVTHAIWNQNGQLTSGYQPTGAASSGLYIGVAPVSGGPGQPSQGSAVGLALSSAPSSGSAVAQATWIDSEDGQLYGATLSHSPYGGYQWSTPNQLSFDSGRHTDLEVRDLGNGEALLITTHNGTRKNRRLNGAVLAKQPAPTQAPFRVKGTGYTIDANPLQNGALSSALPNIPIPTPEFSMEFKSKKQGEGKSKDNVLEWGLSLDGSVGLDHSLTTSGPALSYSPSTKLTFSLSDKFTSTLRPYVTYTLLLDAHGEGKWPGVQPFPDQTDVALSLKGGIAVDAIAAVADILAPGSGAVIESVEGAQSLLKIKDELQLQLNAAVAASLSSPQSGGNSTFPFELKSLASLAITPQTPLYALYWEFEPDKFAAMAEELFQSQNTTYNVSFTVSLALGVKLGVSDANLSFSVKTAETTSLSGLGQEAVAKEVATYKWSFDVDLVLFSLSYGGSGSDTLFKKRFSSESSSTSAQVLRPAVANYEPGTTTHLLLAQQAAQANAPGADLGESSADLVDSSEIAWVVGADGTSVYGVFTGEAINNPADLSFLYFLQGSLNGDGSVDWNVNSLQTLPGTAGANQAPAIALDAFGHLLITWQHAALSNPAVQTVAQTPPGQVYVLYPNGTSVDLASLGTTPTSSGPGFAWTLNGETLASLGQSVALLGDLNGAGKADLALGAPDLDQEQGGVFLLYGETYSQVSDLDNPGANGLVLSGQALSELGSSLANAGDVNGDGKADVVIGAPGLNAQGGGNNQGGAYLLFGGTGLFSQPQTSTAIDALLASHPEYGLAWRGTQVGSRFGNAVAGGHDLNGDGRADVAIAAPLATPTGATSQMAQQSGIVTVYSLAAGSSAANSITLTNSTGAVNGVTLLDMGASVAVVPDLNGDHIADLVIGGSGGAVVVFGSASTFAPGSSLDLATLAPGQGVVIEDDAAVFSALQVANAGDVNLDGNNDLLIGSPATVDAQNQPIAGKSYVLFGGPGFAAGTTAITLSSIEQGVGVTGFVVEGAGSEVAGAGDLNGDGAADLLLSEPQANGQAGISYVIYGGKANHIGTVATLNVADIGTSVQGYTIGGGAANALSGAAASAAGDLNGDGRADLLLGAPDSPSQTALNNLQDALQSQYIIAPSAANPQFSAAAALPYTNRANPSLEELTLTSTSQGILATWVDTSSGAPALMAAFWTIGGGWQRTPATITTGTANTSISDIEVAGSGKTVILSWVQNDNSTSTASQGQSTFTRNLWTPAIVTTDSNPQPPATIDNIIQNPNVGRSSDGSNRYAISHRSVNETDGVVVFTVTRSGDLSRPTMLRYRTEDGSATAGADYEHSEGLLTFAPSESEKSVTIKLLNDALNEYRSESFKLKLSDGEGLALEARATLQDASPINLLAIDSGFQMKGPGAAMLGAALAPGGPIGQSSSTGQPLDSLWIAAPADDGGGGVLYLLRGQSGAEAVDTGLNLDAPGPNTTVITVTRPSNAASATPQTGARITSWQNATTSWTAVSAPNASGQGGQNDSQIFVFDSSALAGGSSRRIAIDSLATNPIRGNSADGFGAAVALADLDGDGRPELLVSAPLAGKVFVYGLSGSGTTISAGHPVATISAPGSVGLGSALSVLDLNGDHHLDIAIGASLYAPLHDSSGAVLGYGGGVYVLAGNGQMPGNTTLPASATYQGQAVLTATQVSGKLNPSSGATRNNPNPSPDTPFTESIGDALASVDLNGDGIADLVIGAPTAAVSGVSNLGKAYVVFGGSTALSTKLASLSAGQGLVLEGVLANGQAGSAVANAGDVNNDQIDDLLVGAPLAYGNAGSAYLLFGSRNAYSQAAGITTISLDPNLQDSRVFQFQGIANPLSNTKIFNPGSVGYALGGIGDINGDYGKGTSGGDDILLGAPSANDGTGNGQAYVAIGHPWLRGGLALSVHDLRGDNGFILPNGQPATAVGDVNGDGFADILNIGGGDTFNQPLGNLLTLGADTLSELNGPRTFSLASITLGYELSLQANGDLVLVDANGNQVWNTSTAGSNAAYAVMQGDGNFVLYTAAGQAVWASNTPGHPGAVLSLAPDGSLWITTAAGGPIQQLTGGGDAALLNQAQVLLSKYQQLTVSGTAVLSALQATAATYQLAFSAADGSLNYTVAGGSQLWQSAIPTAPPGWTVLPSTARAGIDSSSGNLYITYQILKDDFSEDDARSLKVTSAGVPGSALVITAGGGLYLLSPQGQALETLAGGAYDPSLPQTMAPSSFSTPVTLNTSAQTGSELVLQANGNLLLNLSTPSGTSTLWQTGSSGSGGTTATMQSDGNFVLYTAAGQAVWASNTANAPGATLHLMANGALTLQSSSGQVIETLYPGQSGTWPPTQAILATHQQLTTANTATIGQATWPETTAVTQQVAQGDFNADGYQDFLTLTTGIKPAGGITLKNGNYFLTLTTEGDLVLLDTAKGSLVWHTNTAGSGASKAIMQTDGNFVLYSDNNKAVWASNTQDLSTASASLHLDANGNLFIYQTFYDGYWRVWPLAGSYQPNPQPSDALLGINQFMLGNNGNWSLDLHSGSAAISNTVDTQPLFSPETVRVSLSGAQQSLSGDINGDGYDDVILVTNDSNNNAILSFLLGSASGLQAQSLTYNLGIQQPGSGIGLADINGQGDKEILTGSYAWNNGGGVTLSAWRFDPEKGLAPIQIGMSATSIPTASTTPVSDNTVISSADFNGDGYEDALFSSYVLEQITGPVISSSLYGTDIIFWGTGSSATFGQQKTSVSPTSISKPPTLPAASVAVGDVNADGMDDFLMDQLIPTYTGVPTTNNSGWLQLGSSALSRKTSLSRGGGLDQIQVEGLPNRVHPYQISGGGDVNGDGYDDMLLSDSDNQLTYVVYGLDWQTQAQQIGGTTFFQGTNGNDVIQVTGDLAPGSHVLIQGMNGDDYAIVPVRTGDQYAFIVSGFGGAGNDSFGLGSTDTASIGTIDGGSGYDTVFIPANLGGANGLDLTERPGLLQSIECIDLGYDNSVTFDLATLLTSLDSSKRLVINGAASYAHPSDAMSVPWTRLGSDAAGGTVYDVYGVSGTAVQVWIEQDGVSWVPVTPTAPQNTVIGLHKVAMGDAPGRPLKAIANLSQQGDNRPLLAIGVEESLLSLGNTQESSNNSVSIEASVTSAGALATAIGLNLSTLQLRPGNDTITIEAAIAGTGPGIAVAVRDSLVSGNRGDDSITLRGQFWGDRALIFGGAGNDTITGYGIGRDSFIQAGDGNDIVSLGRLETTPGAAPLERAKGDPIQPSTYRGGAGFDVLVLRDTTKAEFEAQATPFTDGNQSGWLFQGARFSGFEQFLFG